MELTRKHPNEDESSSSSPLSLSAPHQHHRDFSADSSYWSPWRTAEALEARAEGGGDLCPYREVTLQVCQILRYWGGDRSSAGSNGDGDAAAPAAAPAVFQSSFLRKTSSLIHETEEAIVALHYLREWWLSSSSAAATATATTATTTATTKCIDSDTNRNYHHIDNDIEEFVAVDVCCGKGYFSMYLKYLADFYWNDDLDDTNTNTNTNNSDEAQGVGTATPRNKKQKLRRRLKTIILLDKDKSINWDHIHTANNDNGRMSNNNNNNNNNNNINKVSLELWSDTNLHDTEKLVDRLSFVVGGKEENQQQQQQVCLALTGIHLCRMLGPSFLSLVNGLRAPSKQQQHQQQHCIYFCLAPCCLPRCVSKHQHRQKNKVINKTDTTQLPSTVLSIHRSVNTIRGGQQQQQQVDNNNNNNNNNIIIQNRTAPSKKHSRCSRRRPCFLCHDTNHLVRDCPEFPHDDPAEGSRIRRAAAATIPCWKCGIVGHFQRNCHAVVDVDSVDVDSDSEMSLSSIDPNNTFCTVVPSSSSNAAAAAKTGMIRVDTRGVMQSKDPFAAYCHLLAQHGLADEWNVKRVINTGFSNHRNKAIAKKHQENWNGFRKSIYIVAY